MKQQEAAARPALKPLWAKPRCADQKSPGLREALEPRPHAARLYLSVRRPLFTIHCLVAVLFVPTLLPAKTIVLTDADCELMAAISAEAPKMSWAAVPNGTAEYGNHQIDLTPKSSFLIRYPLDKIPPKQRITKAEWVIPYAQAHPPTGVRMQVRRILKEWGPGVSHQYRMIRPQRLGWHTPGALGVGQDRAVKATASASIKGVGEHTFNVTEDVELWYSGAAPNYGWQLATDEQMSWFRAQSPFWNGPKAWKLRITYEPE